MTPDSQRILGLEPAAEATDAVVDTFTQLLHEDPTTSGARLMRGQASALLELTRASGVMAPLPVGNGKTLVTLLAPTLTDAKRPVLVLPADLVKKTRTEYVIYQRQGWRVALPELISYTKLALRQYEGWLDGRKPDLLMFDECTDVRNTSTAAWKRIARYLAAAHPKPRVMMLSGTMISRSVMAWWHMALAALRSHAPVPLTRAAAERLDEAIRDGNDPLACAGGYYRFSMSRVGWAQPEKVQLCNASIRISTWQGPPRVPELEAAIRSAEVDGMRPDGELLGDWDSADMLSQLGLGLFLKWDPLPPMWWLRPRARYARYVRDVKELDIAGHDTDAQVADRVRDGSAPNLAEGRAALEAWEKVRDEFTPNTVAVWLDESILRAAVERVKENPTLLWTRWRAVGLKLEELGVQYYGGGTEPDKDETGSRSIALSMRAHYKGKNMQQWDRSLILTPTPNAEILEQLIGRTHRQGQLSDTISVEFFTPTSYHKDALARAKRDAKAISRNSDMPQKLAVADWIEQ
jgi:hypothetical protein